MECENVLTWTEVQMAASLCAKRWERKGIRAVWGVPRGGVVPAVLVAQALGVPLHDVMPDHYERAECLVVDDLVDSGRTAQRYSDGPFDALFRKGTEGPALATRVDGWVVFPWERGTEDAGPEDAVVRLLEFLGEDPTRDGLLDTPGRVLRALREMTAGYGEDPHEVLGTTFDVAHDELVAVTGIEFVSMCEHHMLPFTGTASIGYLPGERIVGLSKLARIVDTFGRRLQVQERMTTQIAEAINEVLAPRGVAVVLAAQHSCMSCRGVRKRSTMVTSSMTGRFRENEALRAEFLSLVDRSTP